MNLQTVKFDSRPSSFVLLDSGEIVSPEPMPVEEVAPLPSVSSEEILEKISSQIAGLNSRTDEEVIELAVSLARTIVEKLVGSTPELCEKRLANILEDSLAGPDQAVGVHVNADNFEFITTQFGEKIQSQGVKLVADTSVAVGECLVRFEEYDLVSKIERQLDDIESHLQELSDE